MYLTYEHAIDVREAWRCFANEKTESESLFIMCIGGMNAAIQLFYIESTKTATATNSEPIVKRAANPLSTSSSFVLAVDSIAKMYSFVRLWWYCATILLW